MRHLSLVSDISLHGKRDAAGRPDGAHQFLRGLAVAAKVHGYGVTSGGKLARYRSADAAP
ncbi:hypothetical protein GCM10027320_31550 [Massilia solisilvae]